MNKTPSIMDDLKSCGKAIMGVIAFISAVATILIEIFEFNPHITIGATAALTILVVFSMIFVARVENRNISILKEHVEESSKTFSNINSTLQDLKTMTAEVRKDTLRIQLRNYIKDEPENLDTILTIANEYFSVYHGNWIAHHEFLEWAESHKVHVPNNIMNAINNDNHNK